MGSAVIHHRHPLADDVLQLIEEEERLRFRVHAARIHIRALVARQHLQQILTQSLKEPFHRSLITGRLQPRRLNRNAQPLRHTHQMLGHKDPAVIDHQGVGHDRRMRSADDRTRDGVDVHQHRAGNPVIRPHGFLGPILARGSRPKRLIQHRRGIDGLRRHRSDPQPGHAAGVPVQRDSQFGAHPPQRDRIQREDIQPSAVHQQVFARPCRPKLPIHLLGAVGDIAVNDHRFRRA